MAQPIFMDHTRVKRITMPGAHLSYLEVEEMVKVWKMTQGSSIVIGTLLGLSLLATGCGSTSQAQPAATANGGSTASGNVQVVQVSATDYQWTMDQTTLQSGTPIEFDVTSKEGTHGFSIVGTSVSKAIMPGRTEKVQWTPPKPGDYVIRCDIYCGAGHDNMFTKFTVK